MTDHRWKKGQGFDLTILAYCLASLSLGVATCYDCIKLEYSINNAWHKKKAGLLDDDLWVVCVALAFTFYVPSQSLRLPKHPKTRFSLLSQTKEGTRMSMRAFCIYLFISSNLLWLSRWNCYWDRRCAMSLRVGEYLRCVEIAVC